jgi:hypothetical protein
MVVGKFMPVPVCKEELELSSAFSNDLQKARDLTIQETVAGTRELSHLACPERQNHPRTAE